MKRLLHLKDKHKGARGFAVGNGPSLLMSDLDRIAGDVSVGSNKIYLAYKKTSWRPTYYTAIDEYVINNIKHEIAKQDQPVFLPIQFSDGWSDTENVHFLPLLFSGKDKKGVYQTGFSEEASQGFYGGQSVTYFNLQLLAWMGCNPIIMVGVDFCFDTPTESDKDPIYGDVYKSQNEVNHFDKNYRQRGELWTQPKYAEMQASFDFGNAALKQKGVKLINASRQSKLKNIKRMSLDDALEPPALSVGLFQNRSHPRHKMRPQPVKIQESITA